MISANQIERNVYDGYLGKAPKQIPHWEPWSNPDAETYLTGINYYDHPRKCRLRLKELYPQLRLPIPETDEPKQRPKLGLTGQSSNSEKHTVRWGDGETGSYEHGEVYFNSLEDVLKFSPLEEAEKCGKNSPIWRNVSSEEAIYEEHRKAFPEEWGDTPQPNMPSRIGFYNTMFMWPLLTFGWELFLEACLLPEFERIMAEFREINRRVFGAFSRMPVNFVVCHDDIVMTNGPVCSPEWMHKYIFPCYEEYFSLIKERGKEVIFMADGKMDAYIDDVIACGARGLISEPYTDYKKIAKDHEGKNLFLCGEGDNRILFDNNPDEIDKMVLSMVETSKMSGGYFMGIGNHIPWNIPPEAVKRYLDRSYEWAIRD